MPDEYFEQLPEFQDWKKQNEEKKHKKQNQKKKKKGKKNLKESEKEENIPSRKYSLIPLNAYGKLVQIKDTSNLKCSKTSVKTLSAFEYFYAPFLSYFIFELMTIKSQFTTNPSDYYQSIGKTRQPKNLGPATLNKWIFSHSLVHKLNNVDKTKKNKKQHKKFQSIKTPALTTVMGGWTNTGSSLLYPIKPRVINAWGCMYCINMKNYIESYLYFNNMIKSVIKSYLYFMNMMKILFCHIYILSI